MEGDNRSDTEGTATSTTTPSTTQATGLLRQHAEVLLAARAGELPVSSLPPSLAEMQRINHDLRVHQIELEVQTEALRRAQMELGAARGKYQDLFESAPLGYLIMSDQGLILEANLTAVQMLGLPRSSLRGQLLSRSIAREDQDSFYLHQRQLYMAGSPGVPLDWQLRMVRADTSIIWVQMHATLTPADDNGGPTYRLAISDITDVKHLEQEKALLGEKLIYEAATADAVKRSLATSEKVVSYALKKTAAILDAVTVGVWEDDHQSGVLEFDDSMYKLYGLTREDWPNPYQANERAIHLDDRQRILVGLTDRINAGESELSDEFRVVHPNGTVRQLLVKMRIERSPDGRPTKVVGVTHDISDLRSAERSNRELQAEQEQLRQERFAAEAANRTKDEFLACMSHEIRTPLGVILGYADLLSKDGEEDLDPKQVARAITRSGLHLLGLVNDVLDLAKVNSGLMETESLPLETLPFLTGLVATFQHQSAQKGLEFAFKVAGPVPSNFSSDELRLRQVLINLVGNAIKFTDHGEVKLTVSFANECRPGALVFAIADTGCGIETKFQESIFEPFTQADRSIVRRYGGTGLGLSLARKLARLLGGDVVLCASVVGQGSVFEVYVNPGERKYAAWIPAEDAAAQILGGETPTSHHLRQDLTPIKQALLAGVRILMVDDIEDNRTLVRVILEKSGAQVDLAASGAEGVEKTLRNPYDLVLLDVQMPEMNGYEAAAAMRSNGFSLPILALTAHAMNGEKERCIAAGYDGYLSKPFNREKLVETIRDLTRETTTERRQMAGVKASEPDLKLVDKVAEGGLRPDLRIESTVQENDPVHELVRDFVANLPNYANTMQLHLSRCDWVALEKIAHQLKGAGGGYGYGVLTDLAARMEQAAQLRPPKIQMLYSILDEFDAVRRRITEELAGAPG